MIAMVVGAALGAWLVLRYGIAVPLLVGAVVVGALALTASGRE